MYLGKTASVNEDIDRMRHAATAALLSRSDVVVVASISCIYGLGVPEMYEHAALSLKVGERVPSLAHLTAQLDHGLQYQRVGPTTATGSGGIPQGGARPKRGEYVLLEMEGGGGDYMLTVHPTGAETALTVEFESTRSSSSSQSTSSQADGRVAGGLYASMGVGTDESGDETSLFAGELLIRSVACDATDGSDANADSSLNGGEPVDAGTSCHDGLESLLLFPASHHVLPEEERARVLSDIRAELAGRLAELRASGRVTEASRLAERVSADLEDFVNKGYCDGLECTNTTPDPIPIPVLIPVPTRTRYCKGLENYSRHLCGRPAGSAPLTLLDYFPENYLLLIDESHVALPQLRAMYPADRKRERSSDAVLPPCSCP